MKLFLTFLKFFLVLVLLFINTQLYSDILQNKKAFYTVDLPVGWELLDATDPARVSFMTADGTGSLKIMVYNGNKYTKAALFSEAIKKELKATGETVPFSYLGKDAVLADLTFSTGSIDVQGYSIFIDNEPYDYALISFAQLDAYSALHNPILSLLDSFSLSETSRLQPGAVSVFLEQTGNIKTIPAAISIEDKKYPITVKQSELETAQDVINREAAILASFKTANPDALTRFYRMVYRDNYKRLLPVFGILDEHLYKVPKKEKLLRLLHWVQSFTYTRTETTADLTDPLNAAITLSGDCDSRVLLLLTLLDYLKIDAVLLVSVTFAHSAIGINPEDYPAQGATIKVGNKKYLYTELTKKTDIGMIAADMADATQWIGIEL